MKSASTFTSAVATAVFPRDCTGATRPFTVAPTITPMRIEGNVVAPCRTAIRRKRTMPCAGTVTASRRFVVSIAVMASAAVVALLTEVVGSYSFAARRFTVAAPQALR